MLEIPVPEPDRSLEIERLSKEEWFLVGKRLSTKTPMYPGSPIMETAYWLTDMQLHGLFSAMCVSDPLSLSDVKVMMMITMAMNPSVCLTMPS